MESEYTRVYNATVALASEGVTPTPTRVLLRLGLRAEGNVDPNWTPCGGGRRVLAGPRLNAVKSAARREALLDMGYTQDWRTGRWYR